MPNIQDFSVPANNTALVTCDVTTVIPGDTLDGSTVEWFAYQQLHGVTTSTVVLAKTSSSAGGGINILSSPPMTFTIEIDAADTINLLGNFYHEATVIDEGGSRVTVLYGLMTVLQTENP